MNTARRPKRFDARLLAAFVLVTVAMVYLSQALDRWAFETFHDPHAERRDWARMFRVAGYLPTWLIVAAAIALAARGRESFHRAFRGAVTLVLSTILSGALAEGVKLLARRERPGEEWTGYVFRAFDERTWSTSGLGLPSSHAAVASAAAFALWKLYPRAWPVWAAIPIGCAWTRLLDRAHYLSDLAAAGAIGLFAVWVIAGFAEPSPRPGAGFTGAGGGRR